MVPIIEALKAAGLMVTPDCHIIESLRVSTKLMPTADDDEYMTVDATAQGRSRQARMLMSHLYSDSELIWDRTCERLAYALAVAIARGEQ